MGFRSGRKDIELYFNGRVKMKDLSRETLRRAIKYEEEIRKKKNGEEDNKDMFKGNGEKKNGK